jgi:uncharacterized membrane protein required for colicin V production
MTAMAIQSFSLNDMPFGWFDIVLVAVLLFGAFRGRKHGMTMEILPTFRLLAIVLAASFGYEFAGDIFHNFFGLSRVECNCLGYVTVALAVWILFIPLYSFLTPRLTGSNLFGGAEYYLGIFAGVARYACIIFFALALMNAPRYSAGEIQEQKDFAFKTFGGGQKGFDGDFFPTFQQVQAGVFKNSLAGPFITDHLDVMLINNSTSGSEKALAKKPR